MNKTIRHMLATAAAFAISHTSVLAVTGEITLSGSTWTGKTDGTTRYTGTNLMTCIQTVASNMGSGGTINLRANGSTGSSGGALKQNKLRSGTVFHGNNFTINCNSGDDYILPFKGESVSNVGVQNTRMTGRIRYGVLYNSCNTHAYRNNTIDASYMVTVCFRSDNARGGTNTNSTPVALYADTSGGAGTQSFGLESNDLTNLYSSGQTHTFLDINGCGVGSNTTNNATYGTIRATRVNAGGSYAGFRTTNVGGGSGTTYVANVESTDCGRGMTYHANSRKVTVNWANLYSCDEFGLTISSSPNNRLNDGSIRNNAAEGVEVWTGTLASSNNNVINSVDTNDGIYVYSGTSGNTVSNCTLNGSTLSIASGNTSTNNTP